MSRQLTKNFNSSEFDSPDKINTGLLMDHSLILKLQKIRDLLQEPIVITSGYRTPKHNQKVGGVLNSSHLKGLAVDIACSNSFYRFQIIKLALLCGITRIGIGHDFIHLDIDSSKSSDVIWSY